MRGAEDKLRFSSIFGRVDRSLTSYWEKEKRPVVCVACFRKLKGATSMLAGRDAAEHDYFHALEDFDIAVVEVAGQLFCKQGTSNNRFPTSPEWVDMALAVQAKINLDEARERRAIAASPEVVEEECARVLEARDQLIAEAEERGHDGIAEFFRRYPVRHSSEDTRVVHCQECSDTGMVADGPLARVCRCRESNPMIRARRAEQIRSARVSDREARAKELNPGVGKFLAVR